MPTLPLPTPASPMPLGRLCLLALCVAFAACAPPSARTASAPEASAPESPPVETTAVAVDVPPAPPALPPTPRPVGPDPVSADTTERPPLPDGFVRLSETAPEIAREIRYTTAFNFVGAPIDGYRAPECILTEAAAAALKRVAADLADQGLGLKVYDCYRPQMAVDHFVRWARTDDRAMKRAFYPEEPKGSLFARGYIATRSGHSRGSTVDLTLVRLPAEASVVPEAAYPDPAGRPLPRCDRPLVGPTGPDLQGGGRFPERDLDMGTAYDCLSPLSATASRAVSAEARRNRQTLKAAMDRRGFRNYSKEWWHFTLRGEPYTRTYHTFPVE